MTRMTRTPLSLALAVALTGCFGGGGSDGGSSVSLSGKAVDGYLSGATVFCDANKNNAQDSGEASTTTNAQGDYTLASACTGNLVAVGGTDITTGYPFTGFLKAPAGAAVITPLTTLVADSGLTNEQLVQALALPAGTDLAKVDPMTNPAVLKKTLAVQQVVQQLANLMGTVTDPNASTKLYTKVASSLAASLAATPGTALFDDKGSISTTVLAAALQKTIANINSDTTLRSVTFTSADISSVVSQVAQQAEQFLKAQDNQLTGLAKTLQNPVTQPPQTDTAKNNYIAPKNNSVIINGSAYSLSQFANPGITLNGLDSIGFEYVAVGAPIVDVFADVAMTMEEIGGSRLLQVKVEQVHVERNASTGAVTLSLTPQSNVYVYAKDSRNNEFSATVARPSFNPISIVNNAVTISYATLVQKVVGNTTYNTSQFSPSQFLDLKGTFKAQFAVSSNMNVRYQNGDPLAVVQLGVNKTIKGVMGPGVQGTVTIN